MFVPATFTVLDALTTVVPGVFELRVTEQLPVVPTVWQVVDVRVPGPLTMLNVIVVPAGALDGTPPRTVFTWPVTVCGSPTRLAPSSPTWIFAEQTENCPNA